MADKQNPSTAEDQTTARAQTNTQDKKLLIKGLTPAEYARYTKLFGFYPDFKPEKKRIEALKVLADPNSSDAKVRSSCRFLYGNFAKTQAEIKQLEREDAKANKPLVHRKSQLDWGLEARAEIAKIGLRAALQFQVKKRTVSTQTKAARKQVEQVKLYESYIKNYNPDNFISFRAFVKHHGIDQVIAKETERGRSYSVQSTYKLNKAKKTEFLNLRRSLVERRNKDLSISKFQENLLTMVNQDSSAAKVYAAAKENYPDLVKAEDFDEKKLRKNSISLETMIARAVFCFYVDPIAFNQLGEKGRTSQVRHYGDQVSEKIAQMFSQMRDMDAPQANDPDKRVAITSSKYPPHATNNKTLGIETSPEKIAISNQRNLDRLERKTIKAYVAAGTNTSIPAYNPAGTPVPIAVPKIRKPSQTHLVPKQQPRKVIDLTKAYFCFDDLSAIDCTYFLSAAIKVSEGEWVNVDHSSNRSRRAVKVGVQFRVETKIVENIDVYPAKVSDFTILLDLVKHLDLSKPNLILTDRGFANELKYGWCAHNRQWFAEVLKHTATRTSYLEKLVKQNIAASRTKKAVATTCMTPLDSYLLSVRLILQIQN